MKHENLQKLELKLNKMAGNLRSNDIESFKGSVNELIDLIQYVEYAEIQKNNEMNNAVEQTLKQLGVREY